MNTVIFLLLHQFAHRSLALDTFFIFVAERLGWVMVAGTFLLPFVLRRQRERYAWFMIGLALIIAIAARLGPVELVRALYPVERPFVALSGVTPLAEVISWRAPLVSHEPTPSFPSGHAALYFALATTLFLWNKKIGAVYYGAAILITGSRVIAGVHWPFDIVAGTVIGGATALTLWWLCKKLFPLTRASAPARAEMKIIIVGGGFGGVRTALELDARRLPGATVTLVSDKPHFEYTPALYRVVTGRSPLEVCIPLRDIVAGTNVEVLTDTIVAVNVPARTLHGASGSRYSFDYLVLALGSETAYFDIPGLHELSFGFKTITEALRLKRHCHELFTVSAEAAAGDRASAAHLVIVGGGASGSEVAGELALYLRALARQHGIDPALVTIDLVEAAPRILPAFSAAASERVARRLRRLGVNIIANRALLKEDVETVYLKDMALKTKTVVWVAGVKPNQFFAEVPEFERDVKGRIIVDEYLQPRGLKNIFVIGDAAATPHTGLAQTADHDGRFVARVIARKLRGKTPPAYQPKRPIYVTPVGPGWAAAVWENVVFAGRIGWWLRRAADLRYFLSILSVRKALVAFQSDKTLCESCAICTPETEPTS